MKRPILYLFLGIMLCLFSCKPKSIQADQLPEYVEEPDNGLVKEAEAGQTVLKVSFKPAAQLALQELENNQACDSLLPTYTKKYAAYRHFVMTYKADDKDPVYRGSADHATFAERLQKFAFHVGDYVYAVAGADTIPLADSYFPNLYGMGGSTQVLLVFTAPENKDADIKVCVKDMGFGLGFQQFDFKQADLANIPELYCR